LFREKKTRGLKKEKKVERDIAKNSEGGNGAIWGDHAKAYFLLKCRWVGGESDGGQRVKTGESDRNRFAIKGRRVF